MAEVARRAGAGLRAGVQGGAGRISADAAGQEGRSAGGDQRYHSEP